MSDKTVPKAPTASPPDTRNNPPPPGWGSAALSKFLHSTHQSQYATFHNKKDAFGVKYDRDGHLMNRNVVLLTSK